MIQYEFGNDSHSMSKVISSRSGELREMKGSNKNWIEDWYVKFSCSLSDGVSLYRQTAWYRSSWKDVLPRRVGGKNKQSFSRMSRVHILKSWKQSYGKFYYTRVRMWQ